MAAEQARREFKRDHPMLGDSAAIPAMAKAANEAERDFRKREPEPTDMHEWARWARKEGLL